MTDVRKGDRVRVTVEGEVREVDLLRRHVTLVGVNGLVPTPRGAVEVLERAKPEGKPLTVSVNEDAVYVQRGDGKVTAVYWEDGVHYQQELEGSARRWGEVVYEPPTK